MMDSERDGGGRGEKKEKTQNRTRAIERERDHGTNKEIPRKTVMETMSMLHQKIHPIARNLGSSMMSLTTSIADFILGFLYAWFPRKERFWFLLPALCVSIDFFFLTSTFVCKMVGKTIYLVLLCHKLALLELLESESAAICYAVIFFYPNIVDAVKSTIPYLDYWPVIARWIAVDRWMCRPITMKETYLIRLRKQDRRRRAVNMITNAAQTGDSMAQAMKDAVHLILVPAKEDDLEVSERVTMANHILHILRKVTPLILMLEINIQREGFLVLMTNTERILFGYGFAVLRSGYLFSSMIWISWTIQLTLVMFAPSNSMWCHFIFLIGLVSIRVSHYTAAVEDFEGIDSLNSHSTSNRRKKASRLYL